MEQQELDRTLKQIRNEMHKKFHDFKGIMLFGSYARGDNNEDSDLDIILLFDRPIDRKFKDMIRLRIIDYEIDKQIIFDTHVYNINEILNPRTPFQERVKLESVYYDS